MRNWLRFNAVGLAGIAVQLAALKLFHDFLGLHYLWATALAVETAVIHNFYWHRRWTWVERRCPGTRFLRFQFTTGVVSILGNLFGMRVTAGFFGIPLLPANLLTIGLLYLFNWLAADRYVFRLR
ncbi:MAG: GtrA family protein [Bryobacterales bacterium]|nr:GtrA family protein [Bryobacterales bacterium]